MGERLPPLTGPAGVAERLLLLTHYGIDWQTGWVSRYRRTYWEQLLPDRAAPAGSGASHVPISVPAALVAGPGRVVGKQPGVWTPGHAKSANAAPGR